MKSAVFAAGAAFTGLLDLDMMHNVLQPRASVAAVALVTGFMVFNAVYFWGER